VILESAIVYPALFILFLGLVVGGLAIFRYQEMASLARMGARYASTHGGNYRKDAGEPIGTPGTGTATTQDVTTTNAAGTSTTTTWYWYTVDPTQASGTDTTWAGDIYDTAIRQAVIGLNPSNLTVKVGWPKVTNLSKADNWCGSQVKVQVSYNWVPEIWIAGPVNLTSTSLMPITN
jgi:hypothetical protein